jgi:hypothetical protein
LFKKFFEPIQKREDYDDIFKIKNLKFSNSEIIFFEKFALDHHAEYFKQNMTLRAYFLGT